MRFGLAQRGACPSAFASAELVPLSEQAGTQGQVGGATFNKSQAGSQTFNPSINQFFLKSLGQT